MKWDNVSIRDAWSGTITNRAAKEEVARKVAENVREGQVIGVGSGSTAYVTIQAIADRAQREKLQISVVCTSPEVTLACSAAGLRVGSLLDQRPDWAFDGADEVDPEHNLLKGRGGAMFLEKIMIHASPRNFILVDRSKLVEKLGRKFPVPVEVLPLALRIVERELNSLGATEIKLRSATGKDGPIITENGNLIFDVRFSEIDGDLERSIKAIPGVIESGLFLRPDVEVLVSET